MEKKTPDNKGLGLSSADSEIQSAPGIDPAILREAIAVRDTIARARTYRTITQADDLFFDAEALISSLAYLTGPKAELEQTYRKKVVHYISTGESVAKAEALAKASDEYKWYKKIEAIYQLGEEQIKILKRFKEDLAQELRRA